MAVVVVCLFVWCVTLSCVCRCQAAEISWLKGHSKLHDQFAVTQQELNKAFEKDITKLEDRKR